MQSFQTSASEDAAQIILLLPTGEEHGEVIGSNCQIQDDKPMTPVTEQVCAVIVTFRPSHQFLENVSLLLEQVCHLIIVDNGSFGTPADLLKEIQTYARTSVIFNSSNEGIAAALNWGLKRGIEMGYHWLITFDQDSTVPPGLVKNLQRCFLVEPHTAIAAPSYINRNLRTSINKERTERGEVRSVMTSGMLMPAWLFDRIGLMNETFFIDFVDEEFCRRTRAAGYRIIQSEDAQLLHSVGKPMKFQLFGREFEATNHSAGRKYYQTRNHLWMIGRPTLQVEWWKETANATKSMAWDTFKIILVEDDKLKKVLRIVQGALDAIAGRMGKRVEL
jgi:rhamnosyltransferase